MFRFIVLILKLKTKNTKQIQTNITHFIVWKHRLTFIKLLVSIEYGIEMERDIEAQREEERKEKKKKATAKQTSLLVGCTLDMHPMRKMTGKEEEVEAEDVDGEQEEEIFNREISAHNSISLVFFTICLI